MDARILGTLTWATGGSLRFAEDIANYYSARGAYVWKPTHALLESIVNLAHRGNSLDLSGLGLFRRRRSRPGRRNAIRGR